MRQSPSGFKAKLEEAGVHPDLPEQYPLAFVDVETIDPPQGGSGDRLFRVRAESGDYCLRKYDRYEYRRIDLDQSAKIAFEHSVAARARHRGFDEMIGIVPNRDGGTIVRIGRETYALFEWIRGKIYERGELGSSMARVECAGRTLARFHRAMEGVQPPPGGDGALPEGDVPTFVRGALERTPRLRADLGVRGGGRAIKIRLRLPKLGRVAEKHLLALEGGPYGELVRLAKERGSFTIHGDFKHNNIAFDGADRIVKLWDLHRARVELPLVDLCDGILNFSRGDMGAALRFLRAYQDLRPLDDAERTVLAALVHLRFIYHVYYFLTGLFVEEESAPRAALTLMRRYGARENARRTEGLLSFALWLDRRRFGEQLAARMFEGRQAGMER